MSNYTYISSPSVWKSVIPKSKKGKPNKKKIIYASDLITHGLGHIGMDEIMKLAYILCPNRDIIIRFVNEKGEVFDL